MWELELRQESPVPGASVVEVVVVVVVRLAQVFLEAWKRNQANTPTPVTQSQK